MPKLRPSRLVELDDIISNQIIGEDPQILALVLRIHLALEALLLETLGTVRKDDSVYGMNFPQKSLALVDEGLITVHSRTAYDRFNRFRNQFAHVFGHRATMSELLELARGLERCSIDFSDSVGSYTPDKAAEYYGGLEGVLAEIGWCLLYHAAEDLREAGGRDITAG